MAEILISLTIIGVIAAITLPALQANINESAWKAQRKALYSRMSQAISMMPSLNGYGTYSGEWESDSVSVSADTAAQAFVTDGLAKVLNINNICSIPLGITNPTDRHKELEKCGIPDKLTTMANSKMPFPTNLTELNPMFTSTYSAEGTASYNNPQKYINTNAAAFETKNGESIAVFYNPYCTPNMNMSIYDVHFVQPFMCANFVYDLNGKKGPNKFGKDIGFMTALYPTDSEIVSPMPLTKNTKVPGADNIAHTAAAAACRAQDENSRMPNIDELIAIFYNKQIIDNNTLLGGHFWSGTISSTDSQRAWFLRFHTGDYRTYPRTDKFHVRCIKR